MNSRIASRAILLVVRMMLVSLSMQALELPNISGSWKLNKDASDDPRKVLEDRKDSPAPVPGSGRFGRGRGTRRGGGDQPSGDDGAPALDRFAALETLTIRHRDPMISVTDAAGRDRTIYTDGRKTEEERANGGTTKVTGRWKDGHIEVTSVPERGPRVTEMYAVTADRSQLTVTMRLEGGRMSGVTIRRVYDAVREASPTPAPPPAAAPQDTVGEEILQASSSSLDRPGVFTAPREAGAP